MGCWKTGTANAQLLVLNPMQNRSLHERCFCLHLAALTIRRTAHLSHNLQIFFSKKKKMEFFLQCNNITVVAKKLLCIQWTPITLLKGLSTDQGVISNSLEGWYDLMMTHTGMLITLSSLEGRRGGECLAIRADRWNVRLHVLFILPTFHTTSIFYCYLRNSREVCLFETFDWQHFSFRTPV